MRSLLITESENNQRLDRFLLKYFKNSKRTEVYKWIRKKIVKVNGKKEDESYFLKTGDKLEIYLPDSLFEAQAISPDKEILKGSKLHIVYEDDDILVVDKPAGLLTHPDKTEYRNTLSSYVVHYLSDLTTRTFKPASIQRLDKNTSGLVLFAKNYQSLKKYNELMRERKVGKFYYALVEGRVEKPGEIKGSIEKNEKLNKVVFSRNIIEGKYVHTRYEPVKTGSDMSVIKIELLTGRAHQIRASLAFIGHPLVADIKYGGSRTRTIKTYMLDAYRIEVEGRIIEKQSYILDII